MISSQLDEAVNVYNVCNLCSSRQKTVFCTKKKNLLLSRIWISAAKLALNIWNLIYCRLHLIKFQDAMERDGNPHDFLYLCIDHNTLKCLKRCALLTWKYWMSNVMSHEKNGFSEMSSSSLSLSYQNLHFIGKKSFRPLSAHWLCESSAVFLLKERTSMQ